VSTTVPEALADLLGAVSHPDRLRLLVALHEGEREVAALSEALDLSQPRTSQHLALLRAHHLVEARRDGRRNVYSLTHPELVPWIAEGARFLVEDAERQADLADNLALWMKRLMPG
jgi:ArsR family transcriptional regulator